MVESEIIAGAISMIWGIIILSFPNLFMKIFRVRAIGSGAFPLKSTEEYFGKKKGKIIIISVGIIFIIIGLFFMAKSLIGF